MYLLNFKTGWNPLSFATTTLTTLKDGVCTRNRSSWTPCMYTTSGLRASSLGNCLINPYLACAWLGVQRLRCYYIYHRKPIKPLLRSPSSGRVWYSLAQVSLCLCFKKICLKFIEE